MRWVVIKLCANCVCGARLLFEGTFFFLACHWQVGYMHVQASASRHSPWSHVNVVVSSDLSFWIYKHVVRSFGGKAGGLRGLSKRLLLKSCWAMVCFKWKHAALPQLFGSCPSRMNSLHKHRSQQLILAALAGILIVLYLLSQQKKKKKFNKFCCLCQA